MNKNLSYVVLSALALLIGARTAHSGFPISNPSENEEFFATSDIHANGESNELDTGINLKLKKGGVTVEQEYLITSPTDGSWGEHVFEAVKSPARPNGWTLGDYTVEVWWLGVQQSSVAIKVVSDEA